MLFILEVLEGVLVGVKFGLIVFDEFPVVLKDGSEVLDLLLLFLDHVLLELLVDFDLF